MRFARSYRSSAVRGVIAMLALGPGPAGVAAGQEAIRPTGGREKPVQIIAAGRVISGGFAKASIEGAEVRARGTGGEVGLSRGEVRVVQRELRLAGFDPGPTDGLIGPMLRRALRAFQAEYGLEVCGCVDGATLRALGLGTPVAQRSRRVQSGGREVEILAPPPRPRPNHVEPVSARAPQAVPGPVPAPEARPPYPTLPWALIGPVTPGASGTMPIRPSPGRPLRAGVGRLGRTRPPPR